MAANSSTSTSNNGKNVRSREHLGQRQYGKRYRHVEQFERVEQRQLGSASMP